MHGQISFYLRYCSYSFNHCFLRKRHFRLHLFEFKIFRLHINNLTQMFKTVVKMSLKVVSVRIRELKTSPGTAMFHFSSITLRCFSGQIQQLFQNDLTWMVLSQRSKSNGAVELVTSAMSTGQQRVNKGIWTGLTGVEQYGINEQYEKPFPLWSPCGEVYKASSQRTSCGL